MRQTHLSVLAVLSLSVSACGAASTQAPTDPRLSGAHFVSGGGGGAPSDYTTMATTAGAGLVRTMIVVGARHCVTLHTAKAYGTSPFTVSQVTTGAYNNTRAEIRFPAIAGAYKGAFGWKYQRITPANAANWGGDHGEPAPVTFLDSAGGEADNSGQWVITESISGAPDTIKTTVSATTDVTAFTPSKVAYADLGNAAGAWTLKAAWKDPAIASTAFSSGCIVCYTQGDGTHDFAVVGPDAPVTIHARGWVYGFFITDAGEIAPSDLMVRLTR